MQDAVHVNLSVIAIVELCTYQIYKGIKTGFGSPGIFKAGITRMLLLETLSEIRLSATVQHIDAESLQKQNDEDAEYRRRFIGQALLAPGSTMPIAINKLSNVALYLAGTPV